jgi:small subunit ribosomal protein S7
MPRRATIDKRLVLPDPVYNSRLVTKFINNVTVSGKKTVAEQIFYGALGLIEERTGDDPLKVFKRAVENAKPQVEVKSRRVGGSTYQVPMEVRTDRQQALAIRWLTGEFLDAASNRGGTIKRRDDTHRMAEANKAFAHYRW